MWSTSSSMWASLSMLENIWRNQCRVSLIILNMLEYACIYLKKQSSEYARILNVSDFVHGVRTLYKLLSSSRDRRILNTTKHLRWSVWQKESRVQARSQTFFKAGQVSCNLGTSINISSKTQEKRPRREASFSPRYS